MGGACRKCGDRRGAHRILVGKPEGKRPLGIPRHRWEDNIKFGSEGIGREACTELIWLRIGTDSGHL